MWAECMAFAGGMIDQLTGMACILMEPCGMCCMHSSPDIELRRVEAQCPWLFLYCGPAVWPQFFSLLSGVVPCFDGSLTFLKTPHHQVTQTSETSSPDISCLAAPSYLVFQKVP